MDKREEKQSIRLRIYGIVQGVGFRPYAAKLAHRHGITGSVKNSGGLVEIAASGNPSSLDAFVDELLASPPVNSLIIHHQIEALPAAGFSAFTIEPSEDTDGPVFLSPDLPVCPDCLRELSDPTDERYRHPLIS
jgi:hydrogenase maturation protein HypF